MYTSEICLTACTYESPSRVEARCCILHICRATYSLLELDLAISEQSPYILCYNALSPSQILVSGNHRNVGMGYTTLTPQNFLTEFNNIYIRVRQMYVVNTWTRNVKNKKKNYLIPNAAWICITFNYCKY